jgi:hypothetical protein
MATLRMNAVITINIKWCMYVNFELGIMISVCAKLNTRQINNVVKLTLSTQRAQNTSFLL